MIKYIDIRKKIISNILFVLFILFFQNNSFGQSFNPERTRLVWEFPSYSHDSRLTTRVYAGAVSFGTQEASLYVKNMTNSELYYDISVTFKTTCGTSKTTKFSKTLKPGQEIGGSTWFDGVDVLQGCSNYKDYGKSGSGNSFQSVLDNVTITSIKVRDLDAEKKLEEIKRVEASVKNLINLGVNKMKAGQYAEALNTFEQAKRENETLRMTSNLYTNFYQDITSQTAETKKRMQEAEKKANSSEKYADLIEQADEQFNLENWNAAKEYYYQAIRANETGDDYPNRKIKQIDELQKNNQKPIKEISNNQSQGTILISTSNETKSKSESVSKKESEEKSETAESTYYPPYVPPKTQYELVQDLSNDVVNFATPLIAEWQAERERKWAAERKAYEAKQILKASRKIEYDRLVLSTNDFLFKNITTYYSLLQEGLKKILLSSPVTLEDLVGNKDYDILLGKDIDYVSKKLRVGVINGSLAQNYKTQKNYTRDLITTPNCFQSYSVIPVSNYTYLFYWVNNDFFEHQVDYLFTSNSVLVGLKLTLLNDKIHIKDYYDELIKNLSSNYFMVDANTFLTYDKMIVISFDNIFIYDLNYLGDNLLYSLPSNFSKNNNTENCDNCIPKLGFSFQEIKGKGATIISVTDNSPAAVNELQKGDIILQINAAVIQHSYHLQWFFYAFPYSSYYEMKIKRGEKTLTIPINL